MQIDFSDRGLQRKPYKNKPVLEKLQTIIPIEYRLQKVTVEIPKII